MNINSPDCRDGKHKSCTSDGWCEATDQAVPCPCDCHTPETRMPTAMQAKHLSGASVGKLVEWDMGRSLVTNELQWSPQATLGAVTHGSLITTLWIDWDQDHGDEVELHPTDWVRVTQVPA